MPRLPRGLKSMSRLSAPIPPKCGGARVCFGPEKENEGRLGGKEMANKAIRDSARKMRPNTFPTWHGRLGEWPEFVVSLRREISMMRLMDDAIEAETH